MLYLLVLGIGLAVFVGGRPFALLANVVLLLLAGMWVWVRSALRNLRVRLEPDRPVLSTSDRVHLRLRLNNEGFLPVPHVEVRGTPGCRPFFKAAMRGRVPMLGTSSAVLGPLSLPRGTYRLGPLQVRVCDPLGIWRADATVPGDRVTVYPRVLPVESLPVAPGRSFGRIRTRRPSQEDFANLVEVRAFQPGDNPRLIDWKATARRGSWQVRVLEETAVAEVWLFPDPDEERAVEVAASLARWLLLGGSLVGLAAHGDPPVVVEPGRGEGKWREIMQAFLRVQGSGIPLGEVVGVRAAQLPRGSTIFAIAADLEDTLFDRLSRARRQGLGASVVLVKAAAARSPRVAYLAQEGVGALLAHEASDPPRWRLVPVRPHLPAAGRGEGPT